MSARIRLNQFMIMMLCLILIFSGSACSPQKKTAPKQSASQQEEKKPPKELDKLKSGVEKVETALMAVHEKNKQPFFIQQEDIIKKQAEQSKTSKGGAGGGGGSSSEGGAGGNGGGGSNGGGSSGSGSKGQQPEPTKMPPEEIKLKLEQEKYQAFESIKKDVTTLHSTWNSYEPKAVSDLATQTTLKEFEDTLSSLTKSIEAKDDYLGLMDVTQLSKYLPDFYTLYKTDTPPDLDRIKFAIKKIQLITEKKNYEMAKSTLKYLDSIWVTLKPKLKKDNMDAMNKFEFALSDIKSAIDAQDDTLVKAKSEVMLTIISDIEKQSKKKSK